ncbi:MAG: type 1 glutamine amidotransferase [Spirochaetales bacterium]|nr:type 1 glutamine amidotransferase [Spirochaetales bacterium]
MKIHVLQHVSFEGPAYIQKWANNNGHYLEIVRLFEGAPLPDINEISALMIMGGPMSVTEEDIYPWLKPEKDLSKAAVSKNLPVLGICLGAQMIAASWGALIKKNPEKEIGWMDVKLSMAGQINPACAGLPESFTAFHWHGETFDLPNNAVRLAESEATHIQAFQLNRAIGLQFHLETTRESMDLMLENCAADLTPGPYVQSRERILSIEEKAIEELNKHMDSILAYWIQA